MPILLAGAILPTGGVRDSNGSPVHLCTAYSDTINPVENLMNRIVNVCLCILPFVTACASTDMLPKTAADAGFDKGVEGKTGWSKYEEVARFDGSTREQVFNAAKAGLGSADFALVSANLGLGVVIGQHGMTAHDWNIVAGVYFRERDAGYDVKVIAEGSKDFGFSGDATSGAWTGRILNGMRSILKQSGATATSTTGSK
jgi:hypothetical protein